jgi:hypothetical protein
MRFDYNFRSWLSTNNYTIFSAIFHKKNIKIPLTLPLSQQRREMR